MGLFPALFLWASAHRERSGGHAARVRPNAALTSFAAWFGNALRAAEPGCFTCRGGRQAFGLPSPAQVSAALDCPVGKDFWKVREWLHIMERCTRNLDDAMAQKLMAEDVLAFSTRTNVWDVCRYRPIAGSKTAPLGGATRKSADIYRAG
jgi:hypothetical protein